MNKEQIIKQILGATHLNQAKEQASAFAPSNIALIKYWGKRNENLILPNASSLSISLGNLGTTTKITYSKEDCLIFNNQKLNKDHKIFTRVFDFLNHIKPANTFLTVHTNNNIPTEAGIASSASGAAALVLAVNDLFSLNLMQKDLSILARLISGSGCRSVYKNQFVIWQKGNKEDGSDCFATAIEETWQELCVSVVVVSKKEKQICSREAMKFAKTSPFYDDFITHCEKNITALQDCIRNKNFNSFAKIVQNNCLAMHKAISTQTNAINYFTKETIQTIETIQELQTSGVKVCYTIDAGANIKLLYENKSKTIIEQTFPNAITAKTLTNV